jgi:predicted transcriptional regulator
MEGNQLVNAGPVPGGRRPGGALEAEVLALLQSAHGALTPGEVQRSLGGDLAYSTVVTVLSRMFDKGLLARIKQGRAYAYAPVMDAQGMTARRMRQALESDPDREAVLARFVEDLPATDEQVLRRLLGDLPEQE